MSSDETSSQTRPIVHTNNQVESHQQLSPFQQNFDSNGQVSLTLRLLMLSKEVGGIIGKKGDNIKRFREESGAKINISDGSSLERIVTISGFVPDVFKAFSMICKKFEETQTLAAAGQSSLAFSKKSQSNINENNNNNTDNDNNDLPNPMDAQSSIFSTSGLLSESKLIDSFSKQDSDSLTINNNNSTAVDNNNLNLLSTASQQQQNDSLLNSSCNQSSSSSSNSSSMSSQITMRLIIPASQCGSLIGRGGARIKELRNLTNATIQVAADVLPNSTERVVTIIGNFESLIRCAYHICNIMVDCPPKEFTRPYLPKPVTNPINPLVFAAMAASQATAYNFPGQYPASSNPPDINRLLTSATFSNAFNPAVMTNTLRSIYGDTAGGATGAGSGGGGGGVPGGVANNSSRSAVPGSHEMVIPNGLIGCVIGKGGSKINEIRQISGANIKISSSEGSDKDRTITINGSPEAINLAQYLITITII